MDALRRRAEVLLYELNRPADAEPLIRDALAADPKNAHLHCMLSHSLRCRNRPWAAIQAAREAVGLSPEWAYAHYTLGMARVANAAWHGAVRSFREAIRCNPSDADYYYWLAVSLRADGFKKRAQKVIEDGLLVAPDHTRCLNILAACLTERGKCSEAVRVLTRSLAIDPLKVETHVGLGKVLLLQWRLFRAAWHLQAATRLAPTDQTCQQWLRDAVARLSHLIYWPVFVLLVLAVGTPAVYLDIWLRPAETDNVVCAVFSASVTLGLLGFRRRFREAVTLFPLRLGQEVHTRADRRYAVAGLLAYSVTLATSITVAAMGPRLPPAGSELFPLFAGCTFPLVPVLVWLDWRTRHPNLSRAGVTLLIAVQVAVIMAALLPVAGPMRDLMFITAFFLTCIFWVLPLGGNLIDA
ncbi:tetratricopeptide repeat protein [Fimbriiglobus ruber]|uniref:TPR domain protein, putative component of TonB system n=1 Tax=Fimbriiglobus ruber TaxID=1908690 RepID=A0A225DXP8_9BACT|nr:tetratricopeptide repeat protein [Fimbriiglobus ruber]OWK43308.1 TPR domain protein, putative component of TonB system [Fimbriiglobus ruber]